MKQRKKVKKRILRLVFAMLLTASLSYGIGVGEIQAGNVTVVSSWNDLSTAIANGGIIRLDGDVIAATGNSQIDVKKDVVLDLDGHIIDRNLTYESYFGGVFNILDNATLTIQDNSTGKTGKITGGWSQGDAGCIIVQDGSTLNLEGGSIEGNKNVAIISRAGGVYNQGTFNMSGGKITGNTAGYGAGVLVFEDASL